MSRIKTLAVSAAALATLVSVGAYASSHREAPFVAAHPTVDGTDFYMFKDYSNGASSPDNVVMVANYDPLRDAYGGPNYFSLNPRALYEIEVDNDGSGNENLTFQFHFTNTHKGVALDTGGPNKVAIPLLNFGPTTVGDNSNLNETQTYTVDLVTGDRRMGTVQKVANAADGSTTFTKPIDNIGQVDPGLSGLRRTVRLQHQHSGLFRTRQDVRRPTQGRLCRQSG